MYKDREKANVREHGNRSNGAIARELRQKGASEHLGKDTGHASIVKVKLILPLHNEAPNIESVAREALAALKSAGYKPSILLIDDGSSDSSSEVIATLCEVNPEISYISFSRNFGKEAAIMAGLAESGDDFDVLAYMDSDGQHSPDDLVRLVRESEDREVDLVCGVRTDRSYQTKSQRWMTKGFYRLFHFLSDHQIDEGVGDFNVLRPHVVQALRQIREEHPFMKGLVAWIGYRKKLVPITVRARTGGEPKSSTNKMIRLAFGAFLSFSSWPLRVWSLIGASIAGLAFLYLAVVLAETVIRGRDVAGYATIVALILFFGGIQLLSIGIVGEYIARIHDASKNRPRYIIARRSH